MLRYGGFYGAGATAKLNDRLSLDVAAHKARPMDVPAAINNSFGFGGHNVALIFTRA